MTDGVRYVQTVSRIMSEIALQTRFRVDSKALTSTLVSSTRSPVSYFESGGSLINVKIERGE